MLLLLFAVFLDDIHNARLNSNNTHQNTCYYSWLLLSLMIYTTLGSTTAPTATTATKTHATTLSCCSPRRHPTTQILQMMEAFKEGHTLHIKHAWQLVKEAKEVFSKEETLQASFSLGISTRQNCAKGLLLGGGADNPLGNSVGSFLHCSIVHRRMEARSYTLPLS